MDKRVETYMELIQEQARLKEASEKLKKEASEACDTMAFKTKSSSSSSQAGSSRADHLQHVDLSAEMIAISDYNSVSEQLSDITDRVNALLTELIQSPRITVYDPTEMLVLKELKRDHGWVGSAKLGNCPPEKLDWRHSLDMIAAITVAQNYGIHVIDQDR